VGTDTNIELMLKGTLVNYGSDGVQERRNMFSLVVAKKEALNIA
jgi:hypothetical protein